MYTVFQIINRHQRQLDNSHHLEHMVLLVNVVCTTLHLAVRSPTSTMEISTWPASSFVDSSDRSNSGLCANSACDVAVDHIRCRVLWPVASYAEQRQNENMICTVQFNRFQNDCDCDPVLHQSRQWLGHRVFGLRTNILEFTAWSYARSSCWLRTI